MSEYKIRSNYFSNKNKFYLLLCIIFFTCSTHIFKNVLPFLFMLTKITAKAGGSNATFFSSPPYFIQRDPNGKYLQKDLIKKYNCADSCLQRNKQNHFDNGCDDYTPSKKKGLESAHENSLARIKQNGLEKETVGSQRKCDNDENTATTTHLEKNVEENVYMFHRNSAYGGRILKPVSNTMEYFERTQDHSIYFYSNVLTLIYVSSLSIYLFILFFGVSKKRGILKFVYITNLVSHCVILIILDNIQSYANESLSGVHVSNSNENYKSAFLLQNRYTGNNHDVIQKNVNFYFRNNFNNAYMINNRSGLAVFAPNYSIFLLKLNKFLAVQEQAGVENVKVGVTQKGGHILKSRLGQQTNGKKEKQPDETEESEIDVIKKFSEKEDKGQKKKSMSLIEEKKEIFDSLYSNENKAGVVEPNFEEYNNESGINGNNGLYKYSRILYFFIIVSSICSGYINIYQKHILYCIFYINIGGVTSFLILVNSIFKLLAHFLNYVFANVLRKRISEYIFLFVFIDLIGLVMLTVFYCMWNNQKYLWINLYKIFYNHKYVCFYLNNTYYIYSTDKNIDNILVNIDMRCNKNIEISFCAYINLKKSVFYEYFIRNRFRRNKLKIVEIKDKNFKIDDSTYKNRNGRLESSGRRKGNRNAYSAEKNNIHKNDENTYNRRKKQSFTMKPYSICIETLSASDSKRITILNAVQQETQNASVETQDGTNTNEEGPIGEVKDTIERTIENEANKENGGTNIAMLSPYKEFLPCNQFDHIKDDEKTQHVNMKGPDVNYIKNLSSNEKSHEKKKDDAFVHTCENMLNVNRKLCISEKNNGVNVELLGALHMNESKKTKHFDKGIEEHLDEASVYHTPLMKETDGTVENSLTESQLRHEETGEIIESEKNTLNTEFDLKKHKSIHFQVGIDDEKHDEQGVDMKTENDKSEMEKKKNVLFIPEYDEVVNEDAEEEKVELDACYDNFEISYNTNEYSSLHSDYKENKNFRIIEKIKSHLSSYTFSFFFFTFIYAFLLSIIHIFINYFFYIYLFVFNINIYVSNMYTIFMTGVSLLAIPFSGYVIDNVGAFFFLLLCSSFLIIIAVSGTIYSYKNNLNSEVMAILFFNLIGLSESVIPTVVISQIPSHLCVKNNENIPSAFAIFELVSMVIISLNNYIFGLFLRKAEYLEGLYILFVLTFMAMILILVLIVKTHLTNKRNKQHVSIEDLDSCDLAQPLL